MRFGAVLGLRSQFEGVAWRRVKTLSGEVMREEVRDDNLKVG